ncbi:hypothetical protein P154DRAFT_575593 [Amniculicola lignicola CBS 123094]|uniref:Uncharacterized protein n=1 Tax=Amniculicola lignicola CBS 123094 TaxID=1392246 RepID=A0A6A5WG59_9PLEO|nr:hypothetical protein P154DRAFT_575593 [Amniculicola lignicola CBS 123094]
MMIDTLAWAWLSPPESVISDVEQSALEESMYEGHISDERSISEESSKSEEGIEEKRMLQDVHEGSFLAQVIKDLAAVCFDEVTNVKCFVGKREITEGTRYMAFLSANPVAGQPTSRRDFPPTFPVANLLLTEVQFGKTRADALLKLLCILETKVGELHDYL